MDPVTNEYGTCSGRNCCSWLQLNNVDDTDNRLPIEFRNADRTDSITILHVGVSVYGHP